MFPGPGGPEEVFVRTLTSVISTSLNRESQRSLPNIAVKRQNLNKTSFYRDLAADAKASQSKRENLKRQ